MPKRQIKHCELASKRLMQLFSDPRFLNWDDVVIPTCRRVNPDDDINWGASPRPSEGDLPAPGCDAGRMED